MEQIKIENTVLGMVGLHGLLTGSAGWQVKLGGNQICNITPLRCQRCLGLNPSPTTYWLHVSASYSTSLCLSFFL